MRNLSSNLFIIMMLTLAGAAAACGGGETPGMTQCSADSECDDGDPCNGVETCVLGMCGLGVPAADGAACMTGGGDAICRGGACVESTCGDSFVDETAMEDCDDGNMDSGDGCEPDCQFSCEADADCDNMDACDGVETCDIDSHTCQAGTAVDCSAMTDMCNTGTCAPADGSCSTVPMADDTMCDDGMGCTESDVCTAGACAGTAVDCSMLTDTCNVGTCSADTGMCAVVPMMDGTACDDGDDRTRGEACAMGTCRVPGHAVLMGHDFFEREANIDRIVGNAVRLTNQPPGHVVLIGHDYYASNTSADRLVGNAVMLANTTGTIRVVEYLEHADTREEAPRTRAAIDRTLSAAGRTASYTALTDHTLLDLSAADVLLIPEQERAVVATMIPVRDAWAAALDTFIAGGGVIVVCDINSGGAQVVNRAGLFAVPSSRSGASSPLAAAASTSPIAAGVAPYTSPNATTTLRGIVGGTTIIRDNRGNPVVQHLSPPVQITNYTQFADSVSRNPEQANARAAIDATLATFGWTTNYTNLTDFTRLDLSRTNIFLIHEQEMGADDTLTSIGMAWSVRLGAFLDAGGILIVLDNGNKSARIVNAAGIFTTTGGADVTRQRMTIAVPTDPLVAGLSGRSYTAANGTFDFAGVTEGTHIVTASSGNPVVIHLTR